MKVKIKEYEKMKSEIGVNKEGEIEKDGRVFLKFFETIIPKDRIVEVKENKGVYDLVMDISYPVGLMRWTVDSVIE